MLISRLAILTSHPVQYYSPLFRELSRHTHVVIFFAHRATPQQQAQAGFGEPFDWDIDVTGGYAHVFLRNRARRPGTDHFAGCDTPEIADRLREGRFDALLTMGWHLKSYLQGVFAAKWLGLPVMVRGDSHLQTPRSTLKRLGKAIAYPLALRLFDAALYVGARNREYFRHYRYPPDRLIFSPHCVDNTWFAARATAEARERLRAERGIGSDTFVALFAGKLLPFKRPLDLVEAAARHRSAGAAVEVMVAGSGALDEQLAAEASRMDVPLHALGFRNQSEMPAAYAAADCLVLPSDGRETWGLVANEALACGRPIVVSDACGCAPDLGADGVAGRSFPTGDIEALSRALASLEQAPPSARAISELADRYSVDRAAAGICDAVELVKRAKTHA